MFHGLLESFLELDYITYEGLRLYQKSLNECERGTMDYITYKGLRQSTVSKFNRV